MNLIEDRITRRLRMRRERRRERDAAKRKPKFTAGPLTEFWLNVRIGDPDECWPWIGGTKNGYGRHRLYGRQQTASRIAWELANGPIPDRMFICHTCDNPPCCNLAHLFVGTNTDNQHDAARKGRTSRKLTHEQIVEIRLGCVIGAPGGKNPNGIGSFAARLGVNPSTVKNALCRRTFRWMT